MATECSSPEIADIFMINMPFAFIPDGDTLYDALAVRYVAGFSRNFHASSRADSKLLISFVMTMK